jgi:hypothetical protein
MKIIIMKTTKMKMTELKIKIQKKIIFIIILDTLSLNSKTKKML